MADFPDFPAFFRSLHAGQEPFPWQERLAARVADRGWPTEIGVPTGLGKTACIDIALWSLAYEAATLGTARRAPVRVWYVVNRRLLVDAAYERGRSLAKLLGQPDSIHEDWPDATDAEQQTLAQVAEALFGITGVGSEGGPVHITRLRGGAELGARVPDPSQPALIFATVPMFASRWLFRGYGSSTSMRPVDAALAGVDSLVLLDEAHIAAPLQRLGDRGGPVELCDAGDPALVVPPPRARPVFVALTATGGKQDSFALDADDLANPTVQRRVHASKRVRAATCPAKELPKSLAAHAFALLGEGPPISCVVFANSPAIARKAYDELCRLAPGMEKATGVAFDLRLLTGRLREREAERERMHLLGRVLGAPAGRSGPRDRHLLVVATQTLEVGADLDFDRLVTESAGARAIVQRLGRLNRLGDCDDAAAIVVHPEGGEPSRLYGTESAEVWRRIAAAAGDGPADLSPEAVADIVGSPADVPHRVGELLPNHLWEWAKTSQPPQDEAPPEPFYEGFEEDRGLVSVMWRAHRPEPGTRLVPSPREDEAIEVPIWEMRPALQDVIGLRRLTKDRASLEPVDSAEDLRPGDTVVLKPEDGCYDRHGWAPGAAEVVLDVSPLADGILILAEESLRNLAPGLSPETLSTLRVLRNENDLDPLDPEEERALAQSLPGQLAADDRWHPWLEPGEAETFLARLSTVVARPVDDDPYLKARPAKRPSVVLRSDAFEELSFDQSAATALIEHLRAVGEFATRIATRLGCPENLVRAVGLAGALHDIGKADPRFQRWLAAGTDTERFLLAKSSTPRERIEATRIAAGWPRGGRHEHLSSRLATALLAPEEGVGLDLVTHLIVAHHGEGRPLLHPVADASRGSLTYVYDGTEIMASNNLSVPDWEQPARFRRLCERYGYWGLALLEAIVRQADHCVSQAGQVVHEEVI